MLRKLAFIMERKKCSQTFGGVCSQTPIIKQSDLKNGWHWFTIGVYANLTLDSIGKYWIFIHNNKLKDSTCYVCAPIRARIYLERWAMHIRVLWWC